MLMVVLAVGATGYAGIQGCCHPLTLLRRLRPSIN